MPFAQMELDEKEVCIPLDLLRTTSFVPASTSWLPFAGNFCMDSII